MLCKDQDCITRGWDGDLSQKGRFFIFIVVRSNLITSPILYRNTCISHPFLAYGFQVTITIVNFPHEHKTKYDFTKTLFKFCHLFLTYLIYAGSEDIQKGLSWSIPFTSFVFTNCHPNDVFVSHKFTVKCICNAIHISH